MKKNLFGTVLLSIAGFLSLQVALGQTAIDCSKTSDVTAHFQQIRETTYQYIVLVNDPKRKINLDTLTNLAVTYIKIQTSFNAIFTSMKADKNIFVSKKTICERYSSQLTDLIDQARQYDDRILHIISPGTKQAGLGVSDVLDIIDWIWKKASTPTTFYDQLSWADWADVVSGKTKPDLKGDSDSKSGKN